MNTKLINAKSQKLNWQAVLRRLKSGKFSWHVDLGTDQQGRRIKVSGKTTNVELAEELMLNSITLLGGKEGADLHGEMVRIKGELDKMARVSDNPGGPA